MKKPLLLIALQCTLATLIAQPTLTSAWNPGVGKVIKYHKLSATGSISEGEAGENKTWDFSGNVGSSVRSSNFALPSIVEGQSKYPAATYADTSITEGIISTNFMKESNDSLVNLGVRSQILLTDIFFVYQNPLKYLTYPFTYNSTFSDVYQGDGMNVPYLVFRYGTVEANADAYGTLSTPIGTFENTLRVKRTITMFESINFNQAPNPPAISNDTATSYSWYSADFPGVVLYSIVTGKVGDVEYKTVAYGEPEFTGLADANSSSSFNLFPNPATSSFSISTAETINLKSAGIYSLEGKLIRTISNEMLNGERNSVSTSGIAPGMYFVQLETAKGLSSAKLIIQ